MEADSATLQPQVAPDPGSRAGQLVDWAARHPRAPLALALALALAARLLLIVRTHAMIDGDEALVGIQAQHILQGQFPVYFYSQPYMGSLEAYLAAVLFGLFGSSSWTLRAVPLLLSLLLVYLTWRLARALLPAQARTTPLLAGLAALIAAAPPLYDAVAELRAWGGQIEVYVTTLALLLATVELADRLRQDAHLAELVRRWAVWGFLAGLGIWINPLISYALVACALWLAMPLTQRAWPRLWARLAARLPVRLTPAGYESPAVTPRPALLLPPLAALAGLAVGGLPAWIYAVREHATNLLVYVTQPSVSPAVSGAARHGRLFLGAAITARYVSCIAPRVLDGGLPAETLAELPLRMALLLPPLAGIVCAFWLMSRRFPAAPRLGLPLLYAGIITAIFCLGTSSWGATKACWVDYAGRYAVPMALVEPLLLLALFALPGAWAALLRRLGRPLTGWHARIVGQGWTLALVVLLVAGVAQLGTYLLADPTTTFESPYYRHIALDQNQLLDYLRAHDIHYAWVNHWEGNIVTFETDGATTCADYYDQVTLHGLQRPPGTLQAVLAADHPSFILVVVDPHPLLARELDAQGIPYTLAVLPQSGVTVITPQRTVDPETVIAGLKADYAY
jgi:hypothetical protein